MAFLIRTIDFTASGREIIRERQHDGDTLTIGRSADNDLHLPDLAVEQHHAVIEPADGGRLRAFAAGSLGFGRDGKTVTKAEFSPATGTELSFGSYRLAFSQDGAKEDGVPVTITQTQITDTASDSDALSGFALASALPSKRMMAWISLAAILIAFLAIPVYSHLARDRAAEVDPEKPGQVAMDGSWSTGALSLAHHDLEDNCEACHVEPFQSVQDETCASCHEGIGDHAPIPRQLTSAGPISQSDQIQWDIAEYFGKEGQGSCTTCHTEHEGKVEMQPTTQAFCAECHDGIDKRLTDTKLASAGDFAKDHPQFKMRVRSGPGELEPTRTVFTKGLTDYNGMVFPHDIHLDPSSGVTRMARSLGAKGYGKTLVCADCHTPTKDKNNFEPVNMEDDCEACHSLVIGRTADGFRSLTHGDVGKALADLRTVAGASVGAKRAAISRPKPRGIARKRPGQIGSASVPGRRYPTFGKPKPALIATNNILSRTGVCGECHIRTTVNGRADLMPVFQTDYYLVKGRFTHEAHVEEDCSTCHAASTSSSASDLLMPGIAVCRDCHVGEDIGVKPTKDNVPSTCAMCHQYHPPSGKLPSEHPAVKRDKIARFDKPRFDKSSLLASGKRR
jgi:predicted CXXCH cytochrome family protein